MTIGIIGAGITGLATSYHLEERGVDHVVLEASDEPGGVIRTLRRGGRVLERGPQRARMTPAVRELVDGLGLTAEVVEPEEDLPLFVYRNGRLREVPFDLRTFLRTDLLSWRGKLRVLAEPLTSSGEADETAAELFRRKFGDEAYKNLIGPLFGGIYGSDPAEMYAEHALDRLLSMERRHGGLLVPALKRALSAGRMPPFSFADGMQTLPESLAAELDHRVRLETPVERVDTDDGGYALETSDGTISVDATVVTTPADAAADLLRDLDPGSAAALDRLAYNPMAIVHLLADLNRSGYGYQIPHDEPFDTLGVTWNASLFDRDGVYTCFLGGMKNPDIVSDESVSLGETARAEFAAVTGGTAEVLDVTRLERCFPAYDRSWIAMDDVSLPDGIHLATNYAGGTGIPSRVREAERLAERLAEL